MSYKNKLREIAELIAQGESEEVLESAFHAAFIETAKTIHKQKLAEENSLYEDDDEIEDMQDEIENEENDVEVEDVDSEDEVEDAEEDLDDGVEEDLEADDELENRVEDIEAEIAALEAQLDSLMDTEEVEHDEDIDGDGDIAGEEVDFGGDVDSDIETDMDGDFDGEEEVLDFGDEELEESEESEEDEFDALDEAAELETVTAEAAGEGKTTKDSVEVNKKSNAPTKSADTNDAKPHAIGKGKKHSGFDRESAPSSESVKHRRNVVNKSTDALEDGSKHKTSSAKLNSVEGTINTKSPVKPVSKVTESRKRK